MGYRRARLRWLLIMIVLVAVAPMFALYFLHLRTDSANALRHAHEQAAMLADVGAAEHRQIAAQARNLLEVIGQLPAVRQALMPECERLLKWVHDGRDWMEGIFVVDAEGNGVCGSSPVVRTLNVRDRGYFRDAVKTRKFVFSDVITSRVTRSQVVAAALPLYDAKGALQSVVGVTVSLPWINQVAAEASAKFGGILIALDGKGRVIAYQPNPPADWTLGELSNSPLVKTILSSRSSMFEAKDPAGVNRVFSVAKVPNSGITVAVGLNRSEVLGPIDRRFYADLFFLFLVGAASIAAALLVAEFGLMRGVRALKSAALRLKAGKMGLRVNLPPFVVAELHDLAATYNAMTAEFERLAYLDRLTGLPNRRYLERHLAKKSAQNERALPARQAVLAIDIDGFKPVNDSHGHAVGDRVLAVIARRIAAAVGERGILFRVGGDEFVAVVPIPHMQDRDAIRALGEDVRQALDQAIELDGVTFPVACSVGISLVPDDAKTLAGALVVADAALYEAKRGGRNRVIDNAPPIADEMPGAEARERRLSGVNVGASF